MKTMTKLYKEYRSIFEMSAFICLLALLLIGAGLISYVGSAKADTKISSDCVYYDEERLESAELLKDAYNEAKSLGFDVKIIKHILKLKKKDKDALAEEDSLIELYRGALGI
jgi:uncharacterized protein (UPF0335 family)